MLTEICAEIRNYFPTEKRRGEFTISGGSIAPLDFLQAGQYFRIVGSVFNDGVHQYPTAELIDETFHGEVWSMAVPPMLIALSTDIEKYVETVEKNQSPYTSESFGGYSYTRSTDSNGAAVSWRRAYGHQLNKWRRLTE